ncbi:hypothetical protein ACS0TY_005908 [Phlomoides rotata]
MKRCRIFVKWRGPLIALANFRDLKSSPSPFQSEQRPPPSSSLSGDYLLSTPPFGAPFSNPSEGFCSSLHVDHSYADGDGFNEGAAECEEGGNEGAAECEEGGNEGISQGGNEGEADYEESDYEVDEGDIEDDDDLFDQYVDKNVSEEAVEAGGGGGIGAEDVGVAEGGNVGDDAGVAERGVQAGDDDSGDSDVVCEGDKFDDARISDEEGHDNTVVFNHELIFNPSFELGMIFASKDEFMKAVQSHAIQTRRTLHCPKNDKIRICARCRGEGCDWGINLVKIKGQATFQIRVYNPSHSCPPIFKVKNMKSTWLGERFVPDFQNEPKRKVDGWRKWIMKDLNVNISRSQAYRAKNLALGLIDGRPDEQYSKLWDYAQELRNSNLNSTIILDNDEEGRFRGMYVCFQAVKIGFRSGCRPFIGIDGCWLKGPHGGILLSAVGVDPGNSIYPIAYAVVSAENRDTWG